LLVGAVVFGRATFTPPEPAERGAPAPVEAAPGDPEPAVPTAAATLRRPCPHVFGPHPATGAAVFTICWPAASRPRPSSRRRATAPVTWGVANDRPARGAWGFVAEGCFGCLQAGPTRVSSP